MVSFGGTVCLDGQTDPGVTVEARRAPVAVGGDGGRRGCRSRPLDVAIVGNRARRHPCPGLCMASVVLLRVAALWHGARAGQGAGPDDAGARSTSIAAAAGASLAFQRLLRCCGGGGSARLQAFAQGGDSSARAREAAERARGRPRFRQAEAGLRSGEAATPLRVAGPPGQPGDDLGSRRVRALRSPQSRGWRATRRRRDKAVQPGPGGAGRRPPRSRVATGRKAPADQRTVATRLPPGKPAERVQVDARAPPCAASNTSDIAGSRAPPSVRLQRGRGTRPRRSRARPRPRGGQPARAGPG